MYIEFVGVPGAGKTTVAEEVCILLEKSGVDYATRMNFFGPEEKRSRKTLWSLSHLQYLDIRGLILWLRLSFRRRLGFEKTATRIHEYQKLRYQLSRKKERRIVVWDNGFIQWFSNHALVGILSQESAVYFIKDRLPSNVLFVFMDTSIQESVSRMLEREKRLRATIGVAMGEKGAIEKKEIAESFSQSRRMQKNLLEELSKQGITCMVLDGTKAPEENAAVVYDEIKRNHKENKVK